MLHLLLGMDLRSVLYPDSVTLTIPRPNPQIDLHALLRRQADASQLPSAPEALNRTELAQPAVFVIEYALARLLMHWGIRPQAMLGYSLGEYVAATLAGVLSLEDALTLVARRARLIAALPAGAMLSVALSAEDLQAYLQAHEAYEVDLAVIAAPQTCVVSGTPEMIAAFEAALIEDEIACFRVETTHAFHSRMLQPAKKALTQLVKGMLLCPPAIPYISNVTGTWITNQQATSPEYWAEHMCETVRFADGVGCLLQKTSPLLLEVGVGQTLGSFVRQHPACDRARMGQIFATQPARSPEQGYAFFMTSLGRLWLAGVELDWQRFYENEVRRRVPLPTYPFERQRYWIDVQDWRQRSTPTPSGKSGKGLAGERKAEMAHWFSLPSWRQGRPLAPSAIQASGTNWLIFLDEIGYGEALAERLRAAGGQVVTVTPGMGFAHTGDQQYCLDPRNPSGYQRLLQALGAQQFWPEQILHGWSLSPVDASVTSERQLDLSFYSLLALAQALGEVKLEHCTLTILANGLYDVLGHEKLLPEKATLLGPCLVIPQEYAALRCHLLELDLPLSSTATSAVQEALLEQIANELTAETRERIVALRGARRWLPTFEEVQIPEPVQAGYGLRPQGVYLITGGLGGIGLALAETLATVSQARLILIGREGLPERGTWAEVLATTTPDHPFNRRITAIQHIEALGAQVLVLAADVANEAQMREVVEQTRARFGEINGVLHLAGVPGVGLMQLKTRDAAAAVLAPKVQGTLVLERLFQTTPLDFCLLFSSITALTGGPGQVDYSAANAFLDTYARSRQAPYPVVAIDWGEWEWNAWSDGLAGYDEATRIFFEKNRRAFGISLKEGATVFQRLLSSTFAQVIVSTQDIQALVELGATYNIHAELPWQQPQRQTQITHPRPALKNSYIAPRNDDERKMARIWEEQLAIDGIGIYDNFFDLGGNSLLGVNLLIQVRKEFHLEQLPAYVLYESPCVEAMTQYLTQGKQGITVHALDERSSKRQMLMKKRIREKNA
jgi:acyl transferase domain-containing protein